MVLERLNKLRGQAGAVIKGAEQRGAQAAARVEQAVSSVEQRLLHHAGKIDSALQGERQEITDPAVLAAVESAKRVIGHRYLVVTPYGVFPTFARVVEDTAAARQHAGDQLAQGDTATQALTLLRSGYKAIRDLTLQEQREESAISALPFGYFGFGQPDTAKALMQDALRGSGTFKHVTSAPEAAMKALLLSLEGPMGTIRNAITDPKSNRHLIDAAITDETMERLGRNSNTVQAVVDARGLHMLFHAAAKDGVEGLVSEAPVAIAMQQAEQRVKGISREHLHTLRSFLTGNKGLLEAGLGLLEKRGISLDVAKSAKGAFDAIKGRALKAAINSLPGGTKLDGLLRETAKKLPEDYNEAMKRAIITGMKQILETAGDPRGAEVAHIVAELADRMNKQRYSFIARRWNGARGHSFEDMLERGITKRAKKIAAARRVEEENLHNWEVQLGNPSPQTPVEAKPGETVYVPRPEEIAAQQSVYQEQIDGFKANIAKLAGDAIEDQELLALFRLAEKYRGKGSRRG